MRLITLFLVLFVSSSAFARQKPTKARINYAKDKICRYRDTIQKAAKAASVPSDLMFACLLSEHVYLVNGSDNWVDAAAYLGIYDDPSLGFTQIKLSTARPLAKQIYHRSQTDKKIIADLLTPSLASHYMAQLIENILTDYADYGFYIHNSPEIVCTSYLVGNSRAKAKKHFDNGTQPKANYYGNFALKYFELAQNIDSGKACR